MTHTSYKTKEKISEQQTLLYGAYLMSDISRSAPTYSLPPDPDPRQ
jgi:hypothetical protein